jgi:O-antigen/teichoic acid export membrane protein
MTTTTLAPSSHFQRFARNAGVSVARICVNSLIALVLPAYLTQHLPLKTYAAWVLIIQVSSFISLMDFGVQAAVAKFVAEHEAKGDHLGSSRCASTGAVILAAAGLFGIAVIAGLAYFVPTLFHDMPASLYRDVRISIVLVGSSLCVGLGTSAFGSVFSGLQQYRVPIGISIVNRLLFAVAVGAAVFFNKSLLVMSAAVAAINTGTASALFFAWRAWASRIRITITAVNVSTLRVMSAYCALQSIWSIGALLIGGMDTTIVGHYAYRETAYYSIALSPNTLMIVILLAGLNPLMPAVSALSTQRSPVEMGQLLSRATRCSTIILCLTGLPLLVCGYPLLRFWVGDVYAAHSVDYLRVLVIATIVRLICAPYSTMLTATGRQRVGLAAMFSEALANFLSSIWLASRYGAIGAAFGTLVGGVLGLSMHFGLSMHYTQTNLQISRRALFFNGVLRPGAVLVPFLLSVPLWRYHAGTPPNILALAILTMATAGILWHVALVEDEKRRLRNLVGAKLRLSLAKS